MTNIHGYTRGHGAAGAVSSAELGQLRASVLFGDDDCAALRRAGELLADQFSDSSGAPIGDYLAKVRARFGQWVRDTCAADYGDDWLAYQHEIGRRHARAAKNTTDGADSTAYVPMRDLIALIVPITVTVRPFLEGRATATDDVDAMMGAWLKAVVLSVALWTQPYVDDGQW
jgi:hypothetical protein